MNEQVEKFKELEKSRRELSEKKIRLEEQFKSKKKDLKDLIAEIEKEGIDPQKLGQVIQQKEKSIKERIERFETELREASEKLSKIEA